jgi:hypothetical protein
MSRVGGVGTVAATLCTLKYPLLDPPIHALGHLPVGWYVDRDVVPPQLTLLL